MADEKKKVNFDDASPSRGSTGWREIYPKEDWWAICLGLGIMILVCLRDCGIW